MSDLTEFLLARIAEVEARFGNGCEGDGEYGDVVALLDIVDADCAVKRRIVEVSRPMMLHDGTAVEAWYLKELALPYADHPDYQEAWRPSASDVLSA